MKEMWVRKRGAPELTQHEHAHQNDCTVSAAGIKGLAEQPRPLPLQGVE